MKKIKQLGITGILREEPVDTYGILGKYLKPMGQVAKTWAKQGHCVYRGIDYRVKIYDEKKPEHKKYTPFTVDGQLQYLTSQHNQTLGSLFRTLMQTKLAEEMFLLGGNRVPRQMVAGILRKQATTFKRFQTNKQDLLESWENCEMNTGTKCVLQTFLHWENTGKDFMLNFIIVSPLGTKSFELNGWLACNGFEVRWSERKWKW